VGGRRPGRGITPGELNGIVAHYGLDPDMEGVGEMLSTPFDCGAYGELCSALPTAKAKTYACGVWQALESHVSIATVQDLAIDYLDTHANACEADYDTCDAMCHPKDVLQCHGVKIGTNCKQLALCDDSLMRMLGFDDLVLDELGPR